MARRLLLLLLALLPAHVAFAAPGTVDAEVAKRTDAVVRASTFEAYAQLRKLWQLWEIAEPTQVEAALSAIATDDAVAPQVRAYAATLEAYARRRRGDLAGSVKRLRHLGFVSQWLVVGPFDNDNRTGLASDLVVEGELAQPLVLDRSFVGKERPVRWRVAPDVHRYGYLDMGAMLRPQRDICGVATTFVRAEEPREASLWIGVTGAFRLYLDRELLVEDASYRQLDAERQAVVVALHAGYNRITAKVCGDELPPALSLRIAGADGAPDPSLVAVATPEASTEAAATLRTLGAGFKPKVPRQRVQGPLQHYAAALEAAGSKPDPSLLESFADYLFITAGDPDASHQARDLARRAAELQPTVPRLLLAAKLAEDRNGQRVLVERAAELVSGPNEQRDVLLARARLVRTGPNPRGAFPLYDDVLRIAPTDVEATLGKVDLYQEAGLRRTALATLERASRARPNSVALLRALSGQLRALGRDVDAAEVEARYAANRFDDRGYLGDQLALAVARRDHEAVGRWSGRLLDSQPASQWAHAAVARARMGLGDIDGAVAVHQSALQIAPEDVATLRALADLYGMQGRGDEQLALLRRILRITPQAKAVRAYVEHIAPQGAREDEKYAWPAEKFLAQRTITDDTHPIRTLRKLAVTTVFDNGLASHFNQIVFQPQTDQAAKDGRNYAFVYHADRQVVQLRAAKVYRKDGRVDEVVESGSRPLNDPSINMYTLQRTFYVRFPRLEQGDVVELRYRIDDVAARNEMSDYFGEITYLQSTRPIVSAEYVLITPKSKKLHISMGPATSGALSGLKQQVVNRGDKRIYRFNIDAVPALETEPRMPRPAELLLHVHASTFASWDDVGRWYWGLAKDKLDVDEDVRTIARKLVAGLSSDRDKVAAIYRYAASETRYVALEFGIEGIRPRRAALTLARGWGDCKDKATLIVSMLGEVGIEAELVLVRTGLRGGFDTSTASLAPFDHAIAYVPSMDLYLDGTAEATGTDELPAMDRSAIGLRIVGASGKLVRLPEPDASWSRETRELVVTPTKDGGLRFTGTLTNRGVDAPGWRRRYQAEASRRERVSSDLATAFGPVELLAGQAGIKLGDLDAVENAVTLEVAGAANAKREGSSLAIPTGPSWSLVRSLASRSRRSHVLLAGPNREHDERWTITVPRGLRVVALPKTTRISESFGSYELDVSHEGNKVVVHTKLRLTKPRIEPSEYAAFRRFCQAVDASVGARLLLAP